MRINVLAFIALCVFYTQSSVEGSQTGYSYDLLHRLTRASYDNGTRINYTYDAAGNRLTLVSRNAIGQTQNYTYRDNGDGTCLITQYTGAGGLVSIPVTIDGLQVTGIGEHAFAYSSVVWAWVPNTVASIEANAFDSCSQLNGIDFGNGVTSIGPSAFASCSFLLEAHIPDSVTIIGERAFEGCAWLYDMTIGNSVTNIGDMAFRNCGLIDVTIPNSLTSIGGDEVFAECANLTNVTIGISVTNIGRYAFLDCSRLTKVIIPNNVISVGYGAFSGCGLSSVTLSTNLACIGDYAFAGCTNLVGFQIPCRVGSVGDSAFAFCTSLREVCFEGNAPAFGSSAVFFNDDCATVYYRRGATGWTSFVYAPTAIWEPHVLCDANYGIRANCFGFTITNVGSQPIYVDACTNLAGGDWMSVSTNALTGGSIYFSDPYWTNYPGRFYRFRTP